MAPLHQLVGVDGHVVPQVVEAELVVGAVGDVGVVGALLVRLVHPVNHQAHGEAQVAVNLAHPLRVALGKIVVDGDDVHPPARQAVEVGGQGGHQGFAFARLHLGDAALMEDDAADELNPIGAHSQHPVRRLAAGGEGLWENIVQRLAVGQAGLELIGFGPQVVVAEGAVFLLQRLDLVHRGVERLDLSLGAGAEYFRKQTHNVVSFLLRIVFMLKRNLQSCRTSIS